MKLRCRSRHWLLTQQSRVSLLTTRCCTSRASITQLLGATGCNAIAVEAIVLRFRQRAMAKAPWRRRKGEGRLLNFPQEIWRSPALHAADSTPDTQRACICAASRLQLVRVAYAGKIQVGMDSAPTAPLKQS